MHTRATRPGFFPHFAAVMLLLGAAGAQSQTIYRIVGADGKVTFSDQPPVTDQQGKVAATGLGAAAAASGAALPFELRQVATKYPVTLYTSAECAPCGSARTLLATRGVPFSERTIASAEDVAALQRISGQASLPFLTIGAQHVLGFSEAEWMQDLDAAGYPKTSQLPASYRNAPARPLVDVQKPVAPKPEEKASAPTPSVPTNLPNPSNPAGIQF